MVIGNKIGSGISRITGDGEIGDTVMELSDNIGQQVGMIDYHYPSHNIIIRNFCWTISG